MEKNRKKIILLILIFIISGLSYFIIDNKLYYFGRNELHFYKPLSFGIVPEYWGYERGMLGFVLLQDDITHIAKGNRYFPYSDIHIDSVISYGFNDSIVIAEVNINYDNVRYVISNGTQNVKFIPYLPINKNDIISKYQLYWINDVNNPPSYLIDIRFWCGFLFFLSFICLVILFGKNCLYPRFFKK